MDNWSYNGSDEALLIVITSGLVHISDIVELENILTDLEYLQSEAHCSELNHAAINSYFHLK